MREETEATQPIVEADQHDALLRQRGTGIRRRRRPAVDEAAAIDPHDHGQLRGRFRLRGTPHVHVQAVLGRRRAERRRVAGERQLHAVVAVRGRFAHAGPGGGRLRRAPAQVAHRRRGERDALPAGHALVDGPLDLAGVDGHDGAARGLGGPGEGS
ncbi:conserved hypothetical protein [Ricinus communis]|uniref:Uncharacterized protein n=1 Tax=Ricinus communis TaxID=3988 RepID=B9TGL0_RICCO|nr:conserved hypothetical protein [Ricinus communis]